MDDKHIKQKAVTGVKWSTIEQVIYFPSQIVVSILMARLILPTEFGLWGMIMIIVSFATMFNNLGFPSAIVQAKEINTNLLSSIFWINTGLGLFLSLLFFLASYPIASFYGQPRLVTITQVASMVFFVESLNLVQMALLEREVNLKLSALGKLASFFVGAGLGLAFAYYGYGVWALIIQRYAAQLTLFVIIWLAVKWRPSFVFVWSEVKKVGRFSVYLTAYSFLNYFGRNADNFIIGKFLTPADLGVYSKGYQFVRMPINQGASVLGRVLFPVMSRSVDNKPLFLKLYLIACQLIALVTFPVMMFIISASDLIVINLMGDEWKPLIPIMIIFSIVGLHRVLAYTTGWIYHSLGRTDIQFRWEIYSSSIHIISFIVGVYFNNLLYFTITTAVFYAIFLAYPVFHFAFKIANLNFWRFVGYILPVFLFSAISFGLAWAGKTYVFNNLNPFINIILTGLTGVLVYFVILHFKPVDGYVRFLELAARKLKFIEPYWKGVKMKIKKDRYE